MGTSNAAIPTALRTLSYKVLSPLMFLGYIPQCIDEEQFSAEEKRVLGLFKKNC